MYSQHRFIIIIVEVEKKYEEEIRKLYEGRKVFFRQREKKIQGVIDYIKLAKH
jgi:hypothetical protein